MGFMKIITSEGVQDIEDMTLEELQDLQEKMWEKK
jgi:hypothetical protein